MECLENRIKAEILENGPMPLDRYMGLCIHHYYAHHHAIGVDGDFTTAPEISQIFGEMVGLWVTAQWYHLGQPSHFILCECGPGRGTLMADIMRVLNKTPACADAADIHLIETSPAMRERQLAAIKADISFHDDLHSLPGDRPIILVANEFLDALPVQQAVRTHQGWGMKVVGLEGDHLAFGVVPCPSLPFDTVEEGGMVEISPARLTFAQAVKLRLETQQGAALMIDYGYHSRPFGDTVQALYQKRPCAVLDHPGAADLTAHVDFNALAGLFDGLPHQLATQQAWLRGMGADQRLQTLSQGNPAHAETLKQGYQRLIAPEQMGDLFKVLEVRSA